MSYAIGQRWLSHADSELGLGIVVEEDTRRVTVHFPAIEEERTYATSNAPLTRLRLRVGDRLQRRDGTSYEVLAVHEAQELLVYEVADGDSTQQIAELELDDRIDLDTPRQRLLTSQFDSHAAFALRLETCLQIDRLQRSGLRGMLGTRTALLPHQLYVANEVGKRDSPRVLLADEVGLGKTIEAGLILHRQLLAGDCQRVLVIVPESLQFQWMVEMRRRFNLPFALYDEERLAESSSANPFEEDQLIICAAELLAGPQFSELALQAEWDLIVVDEVHRMDVDEAEFQFLKQMAPLSAGLLLLTATPEQVGQEAHFERLRLLDGERFHSFERFTEEESRYRQWSDIIDALDRGEEPESLPEDIDRTLPPEEKIGALLDRYGTGRVLFRNSRAAVGGFPQRDLIPHPLEMPSDPRCEGLYPDLEIPAEEWLNLDPRVDWLVEQLRSLRPAKVLVICAHADTALALESYLQLRAGIRSAAFHEHLSLVERDRAAAYFAEVEMGAQALICSEIGGEGRNFQFAQHLILFDLPRHPDQLEQRIGRLDRIGQRDRIFLHVPYISGGSQEVLMRWYNQGMNLFEASCSAGDMIAREFAAPLEKQLNGITDEFEDLVAKTKSFTENARRELSEGRDRLLERSSCDPIDGMALATDIAAIEEPDSLAQYLDQLCSATGVEHEENGDHGAILRPGEQELLAVFPEMPEEGCTVTVSRQDALEREDWIFLGWEHPWLEGAMETVIQSALGQACVGAISLKGVPAGSRLYELVFSVTLNAPKSLGIQRYLPLAPRRLLLDAKGRDLAELFAHDRLSQRIEKLPRGAASKIVKQLRDEIDTRLEEAENNFAETLAEQISAAQLQFGSFMEAEIMRLKALAATNDAVRDSEIEALELRHAKGMAALAEARPKLQAIRLVLIR